MSAERAAQHICASEWKEITNNCCVELCSLLRWLGMTVALSCVCVLQVQHIHAVLAGTSGGMQRAALADLRRDYEADYRYTGKV